MQMTLRPLTRLTNAFSKKWEHHEAALGLFFAWYNFCRMPAVQARFAERVWSVQELLERAAEARPA
jgi:hypothetical protein